ncbi:hypothetical protein FAF44_03245 [Nonomuraea sp. MG754425]|uniref:hypothetical protein n=1 Tax=Nonomuraea sp. MG754425 TaxID=2570319 RepID=UPI001F3658BF|nr:hypothetical protein [Nonomuraea sp. MG754425]MCF6467430.1 hypothetical protein [Nonomuraea sp. MG754425]
MNDVAKVLVGLLILVACGLYFLSAARREREQPEPEPQPEPQETEANEPEPANVTVELTNNTRVTNIAVNWIVRKVIGPSPDNSQPAIEAPKPKPSPKDDGPEWKPPTNLDDLPDLAEWDVEVGRPGRDDKPKPELPPAPKPVEVERGFIDQVRDMLGGSVAPAPTTTLPRPPVVGEYDPDVLNLIPDPRHLPSADLSDLDDLPKPADMPDIHVEHVTNQTSDQIALPPSDSESTVTTTASDAVEVIEPPVELQGVDMASAPLVPIGRRTMARVPTVGGIIGALRTGGFNILRNWMLGFHKANLSDRGNAQHMHRLALAHAQRARVKFAIASNLLQAVQHDQVGATVIRQCSATWLQCHRELVAAYQVAAATGALVRASGGVPTSLKDAIRALERDHGGMAKAARKMTVEPVRDLSWYRN